MWERNNYSQRLENPSSSVYVAMKARRALTDRHTHAHTHTQPPSSVNTCNWQHGAYRRSLSVTCRLLDATFDAASVSMMLHSKQALCCRGRPTGLMSGTHVECLPRSNGSDGELCPMDERQFNFLLGTRKPLAFDVIIMLTHTADCTIFHARLISNTCCSRRSRCFWQPCIWCLDCIYRILKILFTLNVVIQSLSIISCYYVTSPTVYLIETVYAVEMFWNSYCDWYT